MKKHAPPISIVRARELRRNATDAELRMKWLLKQHFPQARFRFQVPLRQYIADFASHRCKVVVEIDGGQHSTQADSVRSAAIGSEGYLIVRFWNNEVLQSGEGCMLRLKPIIAARLPQSNSD